MCRCKGASWTAGSVHPLPAVLLKSTLWYAKRKLIGVNHPRQGSSGNEHSSRESKLVLKNEPLVPTEVKQADVFLLTCIPQIWYLLLYKQLCKPVARVSCHQMAQKLLISTIYFKKKDDMQQENSEVVGFTKTRELGHGRGQSLLAFYRRSIGVAAIWDTVFFSVLFFFLGGLFFFLGILSFWLCSFLILSCTQNFSWRQQRGCFIIMCFSSRVVLLVCCELWLEQATNPPDNSKCCSLRVSHAGSSWA